MDIIKTIFTEYQVRKSGQQKSDVIALIKSYCAENNLPCEVEKEFFKPKYCGRKS